MGSSATVVLLYVLWSLAVLAVITLWFVAISEIVSHARGGGFTVMQLASMAAALSVAAVVAVGAASVVFPPDRVEASHTTTVETADPSAGCGGVRGAFIFSFAIEQPSRAVSGCAARHPDSAPVLRQ